MVEGGAEGSSQRHVGGRGAASESSTRADAADSALAGASRESLAEEAKSAAEFKAVRLKLKGQGDAMGEANEEITQGIIELAKTLECSQTLQMRPAQTEAELQEALKLYRDMNHLSLAGGITCEQAREGTWSMRMPSAATPLTAASCPERASASAAVCAHLCPHSARALSFS